MAFAVAPEGSTMQYTDRYMRIIGQMINEIPEVDTLFEVVAPGLDRPTRLTCNWVCCIETLGQKKQKTDGDYKGSLPPSCFGGLPGVITFQ